MSEHVKTPSRVFLLVVMTAFFMAFWSGDRRPSQKTEMIARRQAAPKASFVSNSVQVAEADRVEDVPEAVLACEVPTVASECVGDWLQVVETGEAEAESSEVAGYDEEIPLDDLWVFGGCDLELPAGIAAGEYRVVNSQGDVRRIELTFEDLVYHGLSTATVPRDLYTLVDGEQRWYFIRVERPQDLVPTIPVVVDSEMKIDLAFVQNWIDAAHEQLSAWDWGSVPSREEVQTRMQGQFDIARQWAEESAREFLTAIRSKKWSDRFSSRELERQGL